ncbi:hypothetical protein QBC36DRAFT_31706 [Triangularia setosa]|uniref:Uncharacterized protein n=1 Tax=Triangularia setosa TaxID=2587417 RepID=A0AAN6W409_9PEZI|nr:hypothetical protein QBC36DRAFT_31706 [Podospora setosa]
MEMRPADAAGSPTLLVACFVTTLFSWCWQDRECFPKQLTRLPTLPRPFFKTPCPCRNIPILLLAPNTLLCPRRSRRSRPAVSSHLLSPRQHTRTPPAKPINRPVLSRPSIQLPGPRGTLVPSAGTFMPQLHQSTCLACHSWEPHSCQPRRAAANKSPKSSSSSKSSEDPKRPLAQFLAEV